MLLYKDFVTRFSHLQLINQIMSLLEWDYLTYLPVGGFSTRAKQIAYLVGLGYDQVTSIDYRNKLEQLVDLESGQPKVEGLTTVEQANLRVWAKDYMHILKLPKSFIEEFSAAKAMAVEVWTQARQTDDFGLFSPWLQKMVNLNKQKIKYIGYKDHPYDALVDSCEPGITTKSLSCIFGDLAPFLSSFVKKIDPSPSPYSDYFRYDFSKEDQMKFNQLLFEVMHISSKYARLDISEHPFCIGSPSDVRLTTNFKGGLLENIFAVLHEGGHALYLLGLPKEEWPMITDQYISFGVHESQSRWWEILIGKSLSFWEYMYPKLQEHFPQLKTLSLDNFYKHINHIYPDCIRIYADEVTYPLHIILRFEIEKQLMEETIKVCDIPQVWNTKMEDLLGIVPKNHAMGCLQDIHWASGSFGYFPCYALGNIYAAQYFEAFESTFPDWKSKVAIGSLKFIKDWLCESIHKHGRIYSIEQSLERVTGKSMSIEPYKAYILRKYQ